MKKPNIGDGTDQIPDGDWLTYVILGGLAVVILGLILIFA